MAGIHGVLVGRGGRLKAQIAISADTQNYVLDPSKLAAYVPGSTDVVVTINAGVVVGSSSATTPAFDVPAAWKQTDTITIVNNGSIVGLGGAGSPSPGTPGQSGGPALRASTPISVTNNGTVGGGGGGGGAGGGARADDPSLNYSPSFMRGGGGGGGAGSPPGAGGGVAGSISNVGLMYRYVTNGSPGAVSSAGAGGLGDYGHAMVTAPNTYMRGGDGGAGGGLGAPGGSGSNGYGNGQDGFFQWSYSNAPAALAGGSGGPCTMPGSNANITWTVAGNRYGALL